MSDEAQVYYVDDRNARKQHRCEECSGVIKVGEIYKYHHGVFDGSGFSNHVCAECERLRTELNDTLNRWEQVCVSELCEAVFESEDASMMKRYIDNATRRGAKLSQWMLDRLADTPAVSPTPDKPATPLCANVRRNCGGIGAAVRKQ